MRRAYSYLLMAVIVNIHAPCFSQDLKQIESVVTIFNEGWQLKGDLILVHSSNSPVVIMLNKANGDRKVYKDLAVELASKGISSFRLDLRGHGESTNKGRFIPFDSLNNSKLGLENGYTDIIAAHSYLLSLKRIDSNRIGVVGASYSGEEMMLASRNFKKAKTYVALSPGSFSAESISTIDSFFSPILFIKSSDERSMKGFETDIFSKSKKANIFVVSGKSHATDILVAYPEINTLIADWFKNHL